ncbi:amidohydrolase family protein [Nocardioides sp. KC13]|uniref:Amidohydrolase family protein n=1 Tax=Nocardioides turkmenicus TaxID=2711220 RepID=A0A6M1R5W0_9ACTN|nr:amidohydrolase family protein [Nocardioides sp. KC13]NGN91827.1 amidohydrolase family protein [Nocardioides sp. KC13]
MTNDVSKRSMTTGPTRRGLLTGAVGVVAAGAAGTAGFEIGRRTEGYGSARSVVPDVPDFDRRRPLVIKGGTILPMTPGREVLRRVSVLIRDGVIAAMGVDVPVPADAQVIDASDMIVMPGMIDTHRHTWQTPFKAFGANWNFNNYLEYMRAQFGSRFTTQDFYNANLFGYVDAIDAGVTTLVDWSHGLRNIEDGEAALQAAADGGGRVRFAWGYATGEEISTVPDWVMNPELTRIIERTNDGGDLVTAQLALDWSGDLSFPDRRGWRWAAERGIPITTHAGIYLYQEDAFFRLLDQYDLLLPTTTYVHSATLKAESYHRIAASDGSVSIAPESEFNFGQGYPPTHQLVQFGINGSLSSDTVTYQSGDILNAIRAVISADRIAENRAAHQRRQPIPIHRFGVDQALEWATIGGARALQMDHLIGTLEVGKRADVVIVDSGTPAMALADENFPQGAVALHATRDEIDTVLIDGVVKKYRGHLVGVDAARALRLAEDTRDRIVGELDQRLVGRIRRPK